MDIKPNPPWLLINSGEDIYEHEGEVVGPIPTTYLEREQAWGRVLRNSSDRDGLIYYKEQSGTRTWKTVSYPPTSMCHEDAIHEEFKLPQLSPIEPDPRMDCNGHKLAPAVRSWPYFAIRPDIELERHVEEALIFTTLAVASGVKPRDMNRFYHTYWQRKVPLPDEYEWMQSRMIQNGSQSARSPPAWAYMHAVIGQLPLIWRVSGIRDSVSAPVAGLFYAEPILPYHGAYNMFSTQISNRRLFHSTTTLNREAEAYEELTAKQEEELMTIRHELFQLKNLTMPYQQEQRKKAFRKAIAAVTSNKRPNDRRLETPLLESIARWQIRERQPTAVCLVPIISSTLNGEEGWGFCAIDGTVTIIANSGPNSNVAIPACGHPTHVVGDHIIHKDFIVVKRGSGWTSRYEFSPQDYFSVLTFVEKEFPDLSGLVNPSLQLIASAAQPSDPCDHTPHCPCVNHQSSPANPPQVPVAPRPPSPGTPVDPVTVLQAHARGMHTKNPQSDCSRCPKPRGPPPVSLEALHNKGLHSALVAGCSLCVPRPIPKANKGRGKIDLTGFSSIGNLMAARR
jgi:hypothetical protein